MTHGKHLGTGVKGRGTISWQADNTSLYSWDSGTFSKWHTWDRYSSSQRSAPVVRITAIFYLLKTLSCMRSIEEMAKMHLFSGLTCLKHYCKKLCLSCSEMIIKPHFMWLFKIEDKSSKVQNIEKSKTKPLLNHEFWVLTEPEFKSSFNSIYLAFVGSHVCKGKPFPSLLNITLESHLGALIIDATFLN